MKTGISFFNLSLKNLLDEDQPILDQARIRLIYYGLLLALIGVITVIPNVYSLHQTMQTYMGIGLVVLLVCIFKYFTYKPRFKLVSHILLVFGCISVVSTVYVVFQTVNIISVQLIILIIFTPIICWA